MGEAKDGNFSFLILLSIIRNVLKMFKNKQMLKTKLVSKITKCYEQITKDSFLLHKLVGGGRGGEGKLVVDCL